MATRTVNWYRKNLVVKCVQSFSRITLDELSKIKTNGLYRVLVIVEKFHTNILVGLCKRCKSNSPIEACPMIDNNFLCPKCKRKAILNYNFLFSVKDHTSDRVYKILGMDHIGTCICYYPVKNVFLQTVIIPNLRQNICLF